MKYRLTGLCLGAVLWLVGFAAGLDHAHPPALERYHDVSTLVVDHQGDILRGFLSADDKWRLPIEISQVDPTYIEMLIAFEDKRYWSHLGVDPLAVLRAGVQAFANGQIVSGASTLTMQTARLLEPRPRTLSSKLIEMVRALQLEQHFSKQEILSIYLTLAPFGGNLEGLRAASHAYFGKEPDHLTADEAALLVALPQSPERQRPDRNRGEARKARDKVLARMGTQGLLSEEEIVEARGEVLPFKRQTLPFLAPRLAQRLKTENQSPVIRTTLQKGLQQRVEQLLSEEDIWQEEGASLAVLVVDNESRAVLAYAGGSDFWGPGGQVDLARAVRSPGSTLKPFVYGLGFDDFLIHPETLVQDRPMVFGDYAPQNFSKTFQGTVSIRQALRQSLNVPAVAVLNEVGPVRLASVLTQAGLDLDFTHTGTAPSLPLALGGVGVSLYELTQAYAGLASGGEVRPLQLLAGAPDGASRRIMGKAAAWYVTDILRGAPMPAGWAQRAGFKRQHDIAFKTGTSYGFRDAWAVGYTPSYTVGVWVGRADGGTRPGHFGRNTAAPVLLKVFGHLPRQTRMWAAPPQNVLDVRDRKALPFNLQRFTIQAKALAARRSSSHGSIRPPVIKFPAHGTAIALPAEGDPETLALRAVGGAQPLRWIVNGRILPEAAFLEDTYWRPGRQGFADIAVIDAEGRSAQVQVRLVMPKESGRHE